MTPPAEEQAPWPLPMNVDDFFDDPVFAAPLEGGHAVEPCAVMDERPGSSSAQDNSVVATVVEDTAIDAPLAVPVDGAPIPSVCWGCSLSRRDPDAATGCLGRHWVDKKGLPWCKHFCEPCRRDGGELLIPMNFVREATAEEADADWKHRPSEGLTRSEPWMSATIGERTVVGRVLKTHCSTGPAAILVCKPPELCDTAAAALRTKCPDWYRGDHLVLTCKTSKKTHVPRGARSPSRLAPRRPFP